MFGLTDADIKLITAVFQSYIDIEKAIIFGSRAMGNYKSGSDVDLALQGTDVTDALANAINIALNERSPLPYKFDVVAYTKKLSVDLKTHIDTYGKVLYQK
jgi:predicted nucleotidyltransferase